MMMKNIAITVLALGSLIAFGTDTKVGTVMLAQKVPTTPSKNMGKPEIMPPMGAMVMKDESFTPGGCGFRKAFAGMVKVYEICFGGKNIKAADWASIFENKSDALKSYRLKLHFLRGVGAKTVTAAFSAGLNKTPSAHKLEEMDRQKFLAWSAALKMEKDSVMELLVNEGLALKVSFFETATATPQTFETKQAGMALGMTAIWLGADPIDAALKESLLK